MVKVWSNTTYGQTPLWSKHHLWSKCGQSMVKLTYGQNTCGQSVVKPHLWSNSPMVKTPVVKPTYVQSPLGSNYAMVKALPYKSKKLSHTSTNRISTYKTFILHLSEYDTLPEWKRARIQPFARMDTCPNGNLPEWTLARTETCPNETHAQMNTCPNGHLPEYNNGWSTPYDQTTSKALPSKSKSFPIQLQIRIFTFKTFTHSIQT